MSTTQQSTRLGTLQECAMKLILPAISITVGLYGSYNDSPIVFYVAALIQSVNNIYDSFPYLNGYPKDIIGKQLIVFLFALASMVLALLNFSGAAFTTYKWVMYIVIFGLSLPILLLLSEIWILFRKN